MLIVAAQLAGCARDGRSHPGSNYILPASQTDACSGPTVTGIDVSSAGQGQIDWTQVPGAGVGFAYIKASQGTYYLDDQFAANWAGAKANGVLRGAYHFFDPTDDGTAQANDFLGAMGTLLQGDLPPALDIECPDTDPECLGFSGGSGDASAATIYAEASAFLSTVAAATGRTPVVYTYGSYFSDNGVDSTSLGSDWLWLAGYIDCTDLSMPAGWSVPVIWQNSDSGNVAGVGAVDMDTFFGTPVDLAAFSSDAATGG